MEYRHPNTPVAIVQDAYRPSEQIIVTTLDKMLEKCINMLTPVLMGNSHTRTHVEQLITPRSLLNLD